MPAKKTTSKPTATKKATTRVAAKTTSRAKAPTKAKAPVTAPAAPLTVAAKPAPIRKPVAQKVSPEHRYEMIRLEAYFIAEKDGFRGDPHQYWTAAERLVLASIGK